MQMMFMNDLRLRNPDVSIVNSDAFYRERNKILLNSLKHARKIVFGFCQFYLFKIILFDLI